MPFKTEKIWRVICNTDKRQIKNDLYDPSLVHENIIENNDIGVITRKFLIAIDRRCNLKEEQPEIKQYHACQERNR